MSHATIKQVSFANLERQRKKAQEEEEDREEEAKKATKKARSTEAASDGWVERHNRTTCKGACVYIRKCVCGGYIRKCVGVLILEEHVSFDMLL